MLLTIDVGNTNIEFGFFEGDTLRGSFRTMTKGNQTSDELGLSLCEYLEHFHWRTEDVEDVIIASVVPSIMYSATWLAALCAHSNSAAPTPLPRCSAATYSSSTSKYSVPSGMMELMLCATRMLLSR